MPHGSITSSLLHLIPYSPHHGIPPHIDELTKTLLIIQTFLESGGYYHTRMMG